MLSSSLPSFRSPSKRPGGLKNARETPDSLSPTSATADSTSTTPMTEKPKIRGSPQLNRWSDGSESGAEEEVVGKSIYMVSDGTGWTAEHSVNAALGQFEHCLVDRVYPINTHLFSGVEDMDRLLEIVKQAEKEGDMLVYTLADPSMCEAAKSACIIWNVPSIDVLGPITEAISSHHGVSPLGLPVVSREGIPFQRSTSKG